MTVSEAAKSPSKKKGDDTESKINDILENVGQVVKMDVDCSKIVEEKIPEAKKLAQDKRLNEALDLLLSLEKQTRTGSDMHSTSKVLVAIVQLCYEVTNVIPPKSCSWQWLLGMFPNHLLSLRCKFFLFND